MNKDTSWSKRLREWTGRLGKFRYPLLVLLLGVVLLLLPSQKESGDTTLPESPVQTEAEATVQSADECRLAELLSRVDGAGKVEVMLTVSTEEETLYQTDTRTERDGGDSETHEEITVLVDGTGSTQSALVRQRSAPVYRGAVIICQGAANPGVKLALVEAVSDLTGLSTDRISVLKMK